MEKSFTLSGSVIAMLLPDAFMDDPAVCRFSESLKAELIPYDYVARLKPDQYTGQLYSLVRNFYRSRGFL